MNVQIPGWKWFPLLKGETPTEPSEARRGDASRPPLGGRPLVMDELNLDCCIVVLLMVCVHQLFYF